MHTESLSGQAVFPAKHTEPRPEHPPEVPLAIHDLTVAYHRKPVLWDIELNIPEGKLAIVNVWASWCVPCRQEHPILFELAKDKRFQLIGMNYKDASDNALRFLGSLGNPFSAVGVDPNGKMAIEWGVYGVPETYLIGKDGMIALKHVGPIDPEILQNKIMPAIEKALAQPAS